MWLVLEVGWPSELPHFIAGRAGGESRADSVDTTASVRRGLKREDLFTGWRDGSRNEPEWAKSLGALDLTSESASCESNHRPAFLRTEGIEESRFPCIRRSG